MTLTAEIDDRELKAVRRRAERIGESFDPSLLDAARVAERALRRKTREMFEPGSGALSRSFKSTLVGKRGLIYGSKAVTQRIYARIQDKGGTIRAKNVTYLTIPISVEARKKRARQFGDRLFFWKRGTRKYLAESISGELKVHYRLKRSVRITGKRYTDAAAADSADQIAEILADATMGVFEG